MKQATPTTESVVRCRPDPGLWILVVLLLPISLAFLILPFTTPVTSSSGAAAAWWEIILTLLLWSLFTAAFLVPSLWLALWLLRGEIVADENGICWRMINRRRYVAWEQVRDYYHELPNLKRSAIETSEGKISLVGDIWKNLQPLRAIVQEKSRNARCSEWKVRGTRECDGWPREFRYKGKSQLFFAIGSAVLAIAFPFLVAGWSLDSILTNVQDITSQLNWPLKILFAVSFLSYVFGLPAIVLLFVVPNAREVWRRREHRVLVDTQSIIFEGGERKIASKWEDVLDYYLASTPGVRLSPRHVIVTKQGDWDYLQSLDEMALSTIIQYYARNAETKNWRDTRYEEALGGESAKWSGGRPGVGQRIYHYRTRTMRALLGLPLALIIASSVFLLIPDEIAPPGRLLTWIPFVLSLLFNFGWWWVYRTIAIRTDAEGIEQHTAVGVNRLSWNEIEEFSFSERESGWVAGKGQRLKFSAFIADAEELKEEIRRHAVNAKEVL